MLSIIDTRIKYMYEKYALLESQIKELELKKEVLREEIIKDMLSRGALKEEHALGKFTLARIKKWTYPQELIEEEDQVKAKKAKAQKTGDATFTESDSLRFISLTI